MLGRKKKDTEHPATAKVQAKNPRQYPHHDGMTSIDGDKLQALRWEEREERRKAQQRAAADKVMKKK